MKPPAPQVTTGLFQASGFGEVGTAYLSGPLVTASWNTKRDVSLSVPKTLAPQRELSQQALVGWSIRLSGQGMWCCHLGFLSREGNVECPGYKRLKPLGR